MTYNALWLYAEAVKSAGTVDKKAAIKALHEVSFTGPSGSVSFNDEGHAALPMYVAKLGGDPMAGNEEILQEFPPVEPESGCK